MDNLNTHKLASLYEAFPPEQARRWDVDHDQLLEGRVYERYCEEGGEAP